MIWELWAWKSFVPEIPNLTKFLHRKVDNIRGVVDHGTTLAANGTFVVVYFSPNGISS